MTRAQIPRRRCAQCRRYFGFMILEGKYCSWLCQGWSPEEIAEAWRMRDLARARRELSRARRAPKGVGRQCRTRFGKYKIKYASLAEAAAKAAELNDNMDAYQCSRCSAFHVGHRKVGV